MAVAMLFRSPMSWRKRLLDAADASGRSDRDISLKAGFGANALNEIRTTDKAPGVDRVLKLAAEIGVSQSYLFLGLDATLEDEEFLSLLKAAPEDLRSGLLQVLRGKGAAGA